MGTAAILVGIIFLAGFIEWIVERLFGEFLSGKWMIYISAAVGIAVALIFKVGVIKSLEISGIDMSTNLALYADYVITGLIMGAGSNKVHEFFDQYLKKE